MIEALILIYLVWGMVFWLIYGTINWWASPLDTLCVALFWPIALFWFICIRAPIVAIKMLMGGNR